MGRRPGQDVSAYLIDAQDIIWVPESLLNRNLDVVNQVRRVCHDRPAQQDKKCQPVSPTLFSLLGPLCIDKLAMLGLVVGLYSGELFRGIAEPALGEDVGQGEGADCRDCECEEGPEVALGIYMRLLVAATLS